MPGGLGLTAGTLSEPQLYVAPLRELERLREVGRELADLVQESDALRLADLFATSSDVASLPEPQRPRLLARIGELAADLPETLELAERSDVHLWFRDGAGG